jgi:hypothetical protein
MGLGDTLSHVVTIALAFGLIMIASGITLWVFEKLHDYAIDWQLQLSVLGLILLVFGGIAVKMFSEASR